jgi:hypothetical protein
MCVCVCVRVCVFDFQQTVKYKVPVQTTKVYRGDEKQPHSFLSLALYGDEW